jgi:hypothetical protein
MSKTLKKFSRIGPKKMAWLLGYHLLDIDLIRLHELLDSSSHALCEEVAKIVQKRHPELFVGAKDKPEKM